MNYTIYQRQQVMDKFIVVHGALADESQLNPGPAPIYPSSFVRLVARCKNFDLYSADDSKRLELWEDPLGTATAEQIAPLMEIVYWQAIDGLWRAATAWQDKFISGVAIGLLTLGVAQQRPKAVAVMLWSGALWTEYYTRKATVLAGATPNYDFSGCGEMPYSVPELREELGL